MSRGGPRENSGRPPLAPEKRRVTVTVRLPAEDAEWLKTQPWSAGKTIERLIKQERASLPSPLPETRHKSNPSRSQD